MQARAIRLCDYLIQGCRGCGVCLGNSGNCVLGPDGADALFELMQASQAMLFAAPVYFYALPGQLKCFIDRSQKFWARGLPSPEGNREAAIIMAAGRKQGDRLFEGSLLTLRWFLKPFGFSLDSTLLLRGLNAATDLVDADLENAFELGAALASRMLKRDNF